MGDDSLTFPLSPAWQFDDGGREAAGRIGKAGDCVCRAVSIASGRPYAEVHNRLRIITGHVRHGRRPSPENGIIVARAPFKRLMEEFGFGWVDFRHLQKLPTVLSLPVSGKLVVMIPRHTYAYIDGVVHDLAPPKVDFHVQGYWIKR
jgi:hypothetical protein